MDTFSLRTFEDVLDPDMLDLAKDMIDAGFFHRLKQEEEGLWSAHFEEDDEAMDAFVEIGRGEKVTTCSCDCVDFDETCWQEDPCAHIAALLYAAKGRKVVLFRTKEEAAKPSKVEAATNAALSDTESAPDAPRRRGRPPRAVVKAKASPKKTKATKTAKGKAKTESALKKDPAEQLLSELEAREIYEFVRTLLGKNKEFRSSFLMHFVDKDTHNPHKYVEIVANAIASVKGRRKYLQGADGAKIATHLSPLYKQAVTAETKGHFREAMAICTAIIEQLPDVFLNMSTASAKLSTIYTQSYEIISLLVKNNNTPFELRDDLFSWLLKEFARLGEQMHGNDLSDITYNALLSAAQQYKRLDDVVNVLEKLAQKLAVSEKTPRWNNDALREMSILNTLLLFHENILKDTARLEAFLRKHIEKLPFFIRLIHLKVKEKEWKTALSMLNDLEKNERKYSKQGWDVWNLENKISEFKLFVYKGMDDRAAVQKLAARLFEKSEHRNFEYLEIEKAYTDANDWPKRVSDYLKQLEQSKLFRFFGRSSTAMHPSYLQLAVQEGTKEQIVAAFAKDANLAAWEAYGENFRKNSPADYVSLLKQHILQEVKKDNSSGGAINALIARLIVKINETEGGQSVAKELTAFCRMNYSNRRTLIQGLKDL